MKVIADNGNIEYYQIRAIELITTAKDAGDSRELLLKQAIGLLALAIANGK
jgi:hypothetical protein